MPLTLSLRMTNENIVTKVEIAQQYQFQLFSVKYTFIYSDFPWFFCMIVFKSRLLQIYCMWERIKLQDLFNLYLRNGPGKSIQSNPIYSVIIN